MKPIEHHIYKKVSDKIQILHHLNVNLFIDIKTCYVFILSLWYIHFEKSAEKWSNPSYEYFICNAHTEEKVPAVEILGEYPMATTLNINVSNETFLINAGNATTFSKLCKTMCTTVTFVHISKVQLF